MLLHFDHALSSLTCAAWLFRANACLLHEHFFSGRQNKTSLRLPEALARRCKMARTKLGERLSFLARQHAGMASTGPPPPPPLPAAHPPPPTVGRDKVNSQVGAQCVGLHGVQPCAPQGAENRRNTIVTTANNSDEQDRKRSKPVQRYKPQSSLRDHTARKPASCTISSNRQGLGISPAKGLEPAKQDSELAGVMEGRKGTLVITADTAPSLAELLNPKAGRPPKPPQRASESGAMPDPDDIQTVMATKVAVDEVQGRKRFKPVERYKPYSSSRNVGRHKPPGSSEGRVRRSISSLKPVIDVLAAAAHTEKSSSSWPQTHEDDAKKTENLGKQVDNPADRASRHPFS